jgi:glycosyltransferase involved in cell wall biosynthesis
MRVVLYNASWSSWGGGEKYICCLAEAISKIPGWEVTILVDKPFVTRKEVQKYFDLELSRVIIETIRPGSAKKILGAGDLAIIMSNFRSLGTPAIHNMHVLQIPYPPITASGFFRKMIRGEFREGIKDLMRLRLLDSARRSDLVLVYSEFVRQVLKEHHAIEAEVLYPPIDDFSLLVEKKPIILSVGRFFTGMYNDKRFDVMIEAFKRLTLHPEAQSWEYRMVGSCGDDDGSRRYLASLQRSAAGYPVFFHVNATYDELRRLYSEASIFWHAAGYGADEATSPERMEHFGMTTVEAMSARCIPIVINKGGQKEIVTHGRSGFVWNTTEDLVDLTMKTIKGKDIRKNLQAGARSRSEDFRRELFSNRVAELVRRQFRDNSGS